MDRALTLIEQRMDPEGFEFTPAEEAPTNNQYVEFLRARNKNLREVEDD
jgi:hypothetical protein